MSNITAPTDKRATDPFDSSARERLKYITLLGSDGSVRMMHTMIFSLIYAAVFYDDIRGFHGKAEDMVTVFETFKALADKEAYGHMYLLLSIQYDYMRKPLPDPVWWLAGESELIMAFMINFVHGLEHLMADGGYIEAVPEGVGAC